MAFFFIQNDAFPAEVQRSLPYYATILQQKDMRKIKTFVDKGGSVRYLYESSEWSQPGPWPDHDDRGLGPVGEPELGPTDVDGHAGRLRPRLRHLGAQPGGGHPLVGPPRGGPVLHYHAADVNRARVHL